MADGMKRKSESGHGGSGPKRSKPWMVPKKGQPGYVAPSIEPGDAGIWATCALGKEGKCTSDLRDLFEDYAAKLYGETKEDAEEADGDDDDDDAEVDIEAEIGREVQDLKAPSTKKGALFQPVKIDMQCVLFFKTRPPIEPVTFVQTICQDALAGATKRYRFVKRLTPMTMMGKATEEGLEKVAMSVLKPVFHSDGVTPKKFAIRPTRRNHNVMKRDDIIRQLAKLVGSRHSVDLKNYDHLVVVEIYRNVLGMSVVDSSFEELKQFNLAEIYDPSPKPNTDKSQPTSTPITIKDESAPTSVAEEGKAEPTPVDRIKSDATPGHASQGASPARSIPNHSASEGREEA